MRWFERFRSAEGPLGPFERLYALRAFHEATSADLKAGLGDIRPARVLYATADRQKTDITRPKLIHFEDFRGEGRG